MCSNSSTTESILPALVLLECGHEDVCGEDGDEGVPLRLVALLHVALQQRAERVQHSVVALERMWVFTVEFDLCYTQSDLKELPICLFLKFSNYTHIIVSYLFLNFLRIFEKVFLKKLLILLLRYHIPKIQCD